MIVKVCGMVHARNIRDVEAAGADWMGFICYPRSPRCLSGVPACMPRRARRVGVFVDEAVGTILSRVRELGLDTVQLHGAEPPALCGLLRAQGLRVVKAFALRAPDDVAAVRDYASVCDYFLFDTPCAGHGGSGRTFDWSLLSAYEGDVPFLLSGGLRPESLQALSRFAHPRWAGIDLNSGFETSPGVKDAAALADFIARFKKLHHQH